MEGIEMTAKGYEADVVPTGTMLGRKERADHAKARLGMDRMGHRTIPGLYSVGTPERSSPVLVTSNYNLSFDALRSNLKDVDAFILVIDTQGINVWCAAGKGTFGTDEVVKAVEGTRLSEKVDHRRLVLPQLGAPGVNAWEVKERTGFKVEYGPVRASDVPKYLKDGECDEDMRTVRFDLRDRLTLAPVEVRNYRWGLLMIVLVTLLVPFYGLMAMALTLGGLFLFPALLPWLPGKVLTMKGMVLGALLTLPFIAFQLWAWDGTMTYLVIAAEFLLLVPWMGYLGLNFTGSTTFTSRTGVRREIFRYVPPMAVMAVAGAVLAIGTAVGWLGGWF